MVNFRALVPILTSGLVAAQCTHSRIVSLAAVADAMLEVPFQLQLYGPVKLVEFFELCLKLAQVYWNAPGNESLKITGSLSHHNIALDLPSMLVPR